MVASILGLVSAGVCVAIVLFIVAFVITFVIIEKKKINKHKKNLNYQTEGMHNNLEKVEELDDNCN